MRCPEFMTPVAHLRCDRRAGHHGKHRLRWNSPNASTVFRWTRTYRE